MRWRARIAAITWPIYLCYDINGLNIANWGEPPRSWEWDVLRVLLSYNGVDAWLAEALRASLFMLEPEINFVLWPDPCSAEASQRCSKSFCMREFDALLLLAGPSGLSASQEAEWTAAMRRAAQDDKFALLPVLAGQSPLPQRIGLQEREWFKAPVVTDRDTICELILMLKSQ
jgi:hypothetical protein